MGHRPMYCTNSDQDDCTKFDDRVGFFFKVSIPINVIIQYSFEVRIGFPYVHTFGLEEIFFKYGVDGIFAFGGRLNLL
jgi:hypothetical protein